MRLLHAKQVDNTSRLLGERPLKKGQSIGAEGGPESLNQDWLVADDVGDATVESSHCFV